MKWLALFFLLILVFPAFATNSELVEKARELLLNSKRTKAYELIVNKISTKNSKAQNSYLKKELNRLSNVFLTEDSQSHFENGKAQFFKEGSEYRKSFASSLELEPENLKVLATRAWFLLRKKECGLAQKDIQKISSLNRYYERLGLLSFYVSLCRKKMKTYECEGVEENSELDQLIFNFLKCRYADPSRAQQSKLAEYCQSLSKRSPQFPEFLLWCPQKKSNEDNKNAYIESCTKFKESGAYRNYIRAYPFLCMQQFSGQ